MPNLKTHNQLGFGRSSFQINCCQLLKFAIIFSTPFSNYPLSWCYHRIITKSIQRWRALNHPRMKQKIHESLGLIHKLWLHLNYCSIWPTHLASLLDESLGLMDKPILHLNYFSTKVSMKMCNVRTFSNSWMSFNYLHENLQLVNLTCSSYKMFDFHIQECTQNLDLSTVICISPLNIEPIYHLSLQMPFRPCMTLLQPIGPSSNHTDWVSWSYSTFVLKKTFLPHIMCLNGISNKMLNFKNWNSEISCSFWAPLFIFLTLDRLSVTLLRWIYLLLGREQSQDTCSTFWQR